MAVQVGLLTKAAVTQVALEGLLFIVDVANMSLEVGRDAEGAITVFTSAKRARGRETGTETGKGGVLDRELEP